MVIHPLEIDRAALWNVVFAVIIGVNILIAIGRLFLRLFLMNSYIKHERFHELFSRKRKEKNEVKRDKENDEGGF